MSDTQAQPMGYGKASGPPLAVAMTEILAWAASTFAHVDIPANIQLDFAAILGVMFVVIIPHDLVSKVIKSQ